MNILNSVMSIALDEKLIKTDRAVRLHAICTGAGAGIQSYIWATPGCSTYFSGASFPYGEAEIVETLGFVPERFCSLETAVDLAMIAYMRAFDPKSNKSPIGLGLTASVASLKEHKGEHRVHAAVITRSRVLAASIILDKGVGEVARMADGIEADRLGIGLILFALGEVSSASLMLRQQVNPANFGFNALQQLFKRPFFTATGNRLPTPNSQSEDLLFFPGSFHPPHAGHFDVATKVTRETGYIPIFSTTQNPPHKSSLSLQEMLERAKMLKGHDCLFTEGDSLYLEKARKFPGSSFVIGADALIRMLDPKWGPDIEPMLREFEHLGTRFYVRGRLNTETNQFIKLSDIPLAASHPCFVKLPGRYDGSSSAIREENK